MTTALLLFLSLFSFLCILCGAVGGIDAASRWVSCRYGTLAGFLTAIGGASATLVMLLEIVKGMQP